MTEFHNPWDVEIEQALLGTMLVDNRQIDIIAADLESRVFYDPLHQRMFDVILTLSLEGSVTPTILNSVMKRDEGYKEIGGRSYLGALVAAAPALPDVRDYVRVLKQFAMRRELIDIGEQMIAEATAATAPQRSADEATERLLMLGRAGAKPVIPAYELAMESLREIEAMKRGESVPIIKTGIAKLDDELGGMRGGDLIVVAAKSGMGKSALMGCIGLNAARAGVPVIVFSLEMMRRQWVERMVTDIDFDSSPTPMWYSKVRNGRLTQDEFDRFALAARELHELPFEIRDEDDTTIQQITACARAFKAKHKGKTGLVVIDYLQIIPVADARGMSREQQVNTNARGAKSLAKLLGWPVIAGSQFNEDDKNRKEGQRPVANDVRESKAIVFEADLILSPYREAYIVEQRKPLGSKSGGVEWENWKVEHDAVKNRLDTITLKNRHGHKPDVQLYCEIAANAIRDEAPTASVLRQQQEDVKGLLA